MKQHFHEQLLWTRVTKCPKLLLDQLAESWIGDGLVHLEPGGGAELLPGGSQDTRPRHLRSSIDQEDQINATDLEICLKMLETREIFVEPDETLETVEIFVELGEIFEPGEVFEPGETPEPVDMVVQPGLK